MVRTTSFEIQILPPSELDKAKWDHTVFESANGRFFAAYDYLQHMAPDWNGLVIGDYEAVLPLIYNTKYRIRYLAALPFVRQLGMIGRLPQQMQTAAATKAIFEIIHDFAKYGDICFNELNEDLLGGAGLVGTTQALPNYELNLNKGLSILTGGYQKSLQGKLRRLQKEAALQWLAADPHEVIGAYQQMLSVKTELDLKADFKKLHHLVEQPFGKAHFSAYQVRKKSSHHPVLLQGIYGKDKHRVYKFMTVISPEGRKEQAGIFALNELIARYVSRDYKLDFMGSGLPGVRSFIESFGALNKPYFLYHFNHLPWPLRLVKK